MKRGHSSGIGASCRSARNGLVFLGAFREVSVIGLAAGLVLLALFEANSALKSHFGAQDPTHSAARGYPVIGIDIDHDQQKLLVHSYPDAVEEIALSEGRVSDRINPTGLVSVAMSKTNSTTVMLSQWVEKHKVFHQVEIHRYDELVSTEQVTFSRLTTADVSVSNNGTIAVVVNQDGEGVGWDLTTPKPVRWTFQLAQPANTNCLSPDGKSLFVVSSTGESSICDVYTGKITISFPLICDCCRRASWSGDGSRLAVGDRKGWLAMYDATNGQQLWQGQLEFLFAQSLSLSADGNLLAVGSFDKQIRIWDFSRSDGSPKIIGGNSSVVMGSVFTHKDTRLVTGCLDGTIREYNLVTNQIIRQIR